MANPTGDGARNAAWYEGGGADVAIPPPVKLLEGFP